MKSIQDQIQELTEELRPYPKGREWYSFNPSLDPWEVSGIFTHNLIAQKSNPQEHELLWELADKASTNKEEVADYADCYRRLKLYRLIGEKKKQEVPFTFDSRTPEKYGTDFGQFDHIYNEVEGYHGQVTAIIDPPCVLGGVWFSREEDRLEALKICGIDKAFQERCAKHKLGGA